MPSNVDFDILIGKQPKPANYLESIRWTFDKILLTLERKNADYATDSDPFRNLRSSEAFGIPTERAIIVRLTDKLSRINNLIDKAPAVANESLEDAIDDAIGYLALMKAYRESKHASS